MSEYECEYVANEYECEYVAKTETHVPPKERESESARIFTPLRAIYYGRCGGRCSWWHTSFFQGFNPILQSRTAAVSR